MAVQFYDGQILFVTGQIAMDPACCCGDGDCDFTCTGTAPTLTALDVNFTMGAGSGCTCDSGITLALDGTSGIERPYFGGTAENCSKCWYGIDLGSCDLILSSEIACEFSSRPGALPALAEACDAHPTTFTGYREGFDYCCYAYWGKRGEWTADVCVSFTAPGNMGVTITVTGRTALTFGVRSAVVRYRRPYEYTTNGIPDIDTGLCTWIFSWAGDWEIDPTETDVCPPDDPDPSTLAECAFTVDTKVFSDTIAIVNCTEVTDSHPIPETTTPTNTDLTCSYDDSTLSLLCIDALTLDGDDEDPSGSTETCYDVTETITVNPNWGCMPTAASIQWT